MYHSIQVVNNKDTDQTMQICRLICTDVVGIDKMAIFLIHEKTLFINESRQEKFCYGFLTMSNTNWAIQP